MADRLIQQGCGVAGRSFGCTRDQGQRVIGDFSVFRARDFAQQRQHHFWFDPTKIKALAPRQHGHWNLANFGGGKDEFYMCWWFFKRLKQRIERTCGQHVNFIDDVNLVPGRGRAIMHAVDDFANIIHTGPRRSIHFHDVDMTPFHDRNTMFAGATRIGCRSALTICTNAIHALGNDTRCCGFTGASDPGHDKSLRDPVRFESVP